MKRILIVDDEAGVRESIKFSLADSYSLIFAKDGKEALSFCKNESFDLMLLDISMPEMDGLDVLRSVRKENTELLLPIIMLTGSSTLNNAVKAMKLGANDYLAKPFTPKKLKTHIEKTFRTSALGKGLNQALKANDQADEVGIFAGMIGKSKKILNVFKTISLIANSNATILITGESGTGKELVAKAIHQKSSRKQNPIIAINCAALPESLAESELFGHEAGSFTNAISRRIGCFEAANGGTLFLDEIGDLSPSIQAKMLRAIQEREILRVGGTVPVKINVRLITATNSKLENDVKEGKFRSDLYYRINVVPILLPPLRDRGADITLLTKQFLSFFSTNNKKLIITPHALNILKHYNWPGNIRELRNLIEQMSTLSTSDILDIEDIPIHIRSSSRGVDLKEKVIQGGITLENAVQEFEKEIIIEALNKSGNIQTHAAKLLGTTRRILKYKMDTLKIKKEF